MLIHSLHLKGRQISKPFLYSTSTYEIVSCIIEWRIHFTTMIKDKLFQANKDIKMNRGQSLRLMVESAD